MMSDKKEAKMLLLCLVRKFRTFLMCMLKTATEYFDDCFGFLLCLHATKQTATTTMMLMKYRTHTSSSTDFFYSFGIENRDKTRHRRRKERCNRERIILYPS